MKRAAVLLLERILVLAIIVISAMVLAECLWHDDDFTENFTAAVFLGSAAVLMFGAMITNLRKYAKTGDFFGARTDHIKVGLWAYIMSRIAWGYLLFYMILLSMTVRGKENDIFDVFMGLALLVGMVAAAMGLSFFINLANDRKNFGKALTPQDFVRVYGEGRCEYPVIQAERFAGTDGISRRVTELLTNGLPSAPEYMNAPPLIAAIRSGHLMPMPNIQPRSFDELLSQSEKSFAVPFNDLSLRLGYGTSLELMPWRDILRAGCDNAVVNRMRDGINLDYFIMNCANRMTVRNGLMAVEIVFAQGGRYFGIIPLGAVDELCSYLC